MNIPASYRIRKTEVIGLFMSVLCVIVSAIAGYLFALVDSQDKTINQQLDIIDSLQKRVVPVDVIDTVLAGKPYILLPLNNIDSLRIRQTVRPK